MKCNCEHSFNCKECNKTLCLHTKVSYTTSIYCYSCYSTRVRKYNLKWSKGEIKTLFN